MPPIRLHDLRHHSAATLLKNGASVGDVMDRYGWRSVAMVNRYRHLLQAGDIEAAKTLGRPAAPAAPAALGSSTPSRPVAPRRSPCG